MYGLVLLALITIFLLVAILFFCRFYGCSCSESNSPLCVEKVVQEVNSVGGKRVRLLVSVCTRKSVCVFSSIRDNLLFVEYRAAYHKFSSHDTFPAVSLYFYKL